MLVALETTFVNKTLLTFFARSMLLLVPCSCLFHALRGMIPLRPLLW
jgi:hypothetical protein